MNQKGTTLSGLQGKWVGVSNSVWGSNKVKAGLVLVYNCLKLALHLVFYVFSFQTQSPPDCPSSWLLWMKVGC